MTKFTQDELSHLALCQEAIQLVFDSGSWTNIDGQLYWVVPEEIAEAVDDLVGDLDADL